MSTEKATVQIQAVIYNNEIPALYKAVESLCNAVRHGPEQLGAVRMVYGDASDTPVLGEEELRTIRALCEGAVTFEYRVFGFNSGFGKGQNLLGAGCGCDYMLVMNPDVIVTPGFFAEMLAPMRDAKVGLVEARQTPIEHHKEYDITTFETEWAAMACVLVRTALWHQLDGIDADTFFMYCEDVDFSWRLRLAGYKIIYQPLAPVFHAKRLDPNGAWAPGRAEVYYSAQSALLMAHKWSNPKREKEILDAFIASPEEIYREIASDFIKRRDAGDLPAPIDPKHKVARFLNGDYSDSRFTL